MNKLILKAEWLFQIYVRGRGRRPKVIVLGPDRRDQAFAKRLAREIEVRLTRATRR